ncbi:MAG: hypothetical protein V1736_02885 [Pseudomonadota bacterium]
MKNGDLWRQSTFEVTAVAKTMWSYSAGEAKDPVDVTIQNNDSTGIVYVNLSGDATVSNTMFMIRPNGDTLSLKNIINNISVIGSISSNTIAYAVVRNGG